MSTRGPQTTRHNYSGKVALVTGGSSGIGRDIARAMIAAGAKVAVMARRKTEIHAAAKELGALAIVGDVTNEEDAQRAVATCVAELGALTTLVNSAGVIGNGGTKDTTTAEWRRIFAINVEGTVFMTRYAIPQLERAGAAASVLNVSSVAGNRPFATITAYCAAKAAVEMLTRCQALELAPAKVRVNCIAPGVVVTNLHLAANAVPDYPAFLERGKATHPLGCVGAVADTTAAALYLCSDDAAWITGAVLPVDGGRALMSMR